MCVFICENQALGSIRIKNRGSRHPQPPDNEQFDIKTVGIGLGVEGRQNL